MQGFTGFTGFTGAIGQKGSIGQPGVDGVVGAQGPFGATGFPGLSCVDFCSCHLSPYFVQILLCMLYTPWAIKKGATFIFTITLPSVDRFQ